ncbi:hypothetical protein J6590_099146 [Homalodisca vitripennis]|nr:hypothetical protein J6590_099146 [Homalodisca vitripennis]
MISCNIWSSSNEVLPHWDFTFKELRLFPRKPTLSTRTSGAVPLERGVTTLSPYPVERGNGRGTLKETEVEVGANSLDAGRSAKRGAFSNPSTFLILRTMPRG